jgi:hypothetical protein
MEGGQDRGWLRVKWSGQEAGEMEGGQKKGQERWRVVSWRGGQDRRQLRRRLVRTGDR